MNGFAELRLALDPSPAIRLSIILEDTMLLTDDRIEYVTINEANAVTVQGCVEVGNSRTAAVFIGPDGQQRPAVWMPSVKSVSGASLYELNQRRELRTGEHCLTTKEGAVEIDEFVGQLALIGGNVEAQNARGSRERGSDGWNRSFILASVKAAFPQANDITLDLVTCIPADWWSPDVEAATVKALKGVYKFRYNGAGDETTVRIRSVRLEREGFVSWSAPGIDKPQGRVLIINGGGDTINLVEIVNGDMTFCKTLNRLGVEVAFDELNSYLKSQGKRALTEEERIGLATALRERKEFAVTVAGKKERVDHFARSFVEKKATTFVSLLKKANPAYGSYDAMYFVGGAAYDGLMGATVKKELPQVIIPNTALEMTDALGALATVGGKVKAAKVKR